VARSMSVNAPPCSASTRPRSRPGAATAAA
jgi:hypothetical protein